jgi:hypothetical protein
MELYVPQKAIAQSLLLSQESFGVAAQIVGSVELLQQNSLMKVSLVGLIIR